MPPPPKPNLSRKPEPAKPKFEEQDERTCAFWCSAFFVVSVIFFIGLVVGTTYYHAKYEDNEQDAAMAAKFANVEQCGLSRIAYPTSLPPALGWVDVDDCATQVACIQVLVYLPDLGREALMQTAYPHERECTQFGICGVNQTQQLEWVLGTINATYPNPPAQIDCYTDGVQAFYNQPKRSNGVYEWVAVMIFAIFSGVGIIVFSWGAIVYYKSYKKRYNARMKQYERELAVWMEINTPSIPPVSPINDVKPVQESVITAAGQKKPFVLKKGFTNVV